MAATRKVANLLGLAVLSVLLREPMHPYQMAKAMREFGKYPKDKGMKWGSLYTVIHNLDKYGYVEVIGVERDGAHPERVVYSITDSGRTELSDWVRELLGNYEPGDEQQYRFFSGLSIMMILPADEVIELLERRIAELVRSVDKGRSELSRIDPSIPELFLVEHEYALAMAEAELTWVRSLSAKIVGRTLKGMGQWRRMHAQDTPGTTQ